MESTLIEQSIPAGRAGRWLGRGFGLALVAGLVLAGWFLVRRGLPTPANAPVPAPVAVQASASLAVADTTGPAETAPVAVGLTLATALLKGALVQRVRGVLPYVNRLSGLLLIGAGAYIVYFQVNFSIFFAV